MSELTRILKILPAWDRTDPNPNKNYGVHSAELRMYVVGSRGAIQFVLYTGWHLPHVQEKFDEIFPEASKPLPADLGYHSIAPHYDGHEKYPCDILSCGECYYDGSGLAAQGVFDILVEKGLDAVWERLEQEYIRIFTDKQS